MSTIEEVRRDREDLARVLKKHTGIRKIVEDLYPDSAHFIYELLQNAEDTGATEACFQLTKTGLSFEHNGRAFTRDDLLGITDIGEGTKAADDDKIGRFGVGFKAVFAYSETPHVWSPTYCFKITDLVLPSPLDARPGQNGTTRFEFPFDNPKKAADIAYAEVEAGLKELAETTLLFLSHLESISWEIEGALPGEVLRIRHSENHFEVLKQSGGRTTTSSHFLKFDNPVEGLEKQRVAIAFALDFLPNVDNFDAQTPLSKQLKIIPASPGHVAVFFPAEKETSGLRFHLHAPFVPELSRASIKETPANAPLFQQLAVLASTSLVRIRDLGLLTVDFLAVLPNSQDPIPARYDLIRQLILMVMNQYPLTPTYKRDPAPAKQLLQAKASLKELLSEDDLGFLVAKEDPPRWAAGAPQKNSNADRFLGSLAITEWETDKLLRLLEEKASESSRYLMNPFQQVQGPDPKFMAWLASKPDEWHQQLHAVLASELLTGSDYRQSEIVQRLRQLKIVRLANGQFSVGQKCFFPSDGAEQDEVLPRIAVGIYSSGKSKSQQDEARKLLEKAGVREVGEHEQVEALLRERYTTEAFRPSIRDIERFAAIVEKDTSSAALFKDYFIFQGKDGKWHRPSMVFLDSPYMETGLGAYYAARGSEATRTALSDSYATGGLAVDRLTRFATAVGAQTSLPVKDARCSGNPQWGYLLSAPGSRFTSSGINSDYTIEHLEEVLQEPSLALSKLVWRTMCSLPERYLKATYRYNRSSGSHYADSQLVHQLRAIEWVPQRDGSFVHPQAASRDQLPEGFAFDPGWNWIKAIKFGVNAALRVEEERQKQNVAKELGFGDSASLERAKRFAALPPDDQERLLADLERLNAFELPEHEPANPARRAERVGSAAQDAAERVTEERTRSVSIGLGKVKEEAAAYLRQQYTNSDEEMICQACRGPLPFKLDDGSDYFEKVEFLPDFQKRHYQNYLALCPNHAAMFQHANSTRDMMSEMFAELEGNTLDVVLAQSDAAIYLTRTHIADLRAVIEADAGTHPEEKDG